MTTTHKLALASGVVKELSPLQTVHAAAAGNWDLVGLWVDPSTWTDTTTTEVLAALHETKLDVIDIEVLRLYPGPLDPSAFRVLDIGMAIGAMNVLVMSEDSSPEGTADKLGELCRHVEGNGGDMRVNLEFGYFSSGCQTLAEASRILDLVDHHLAAILVDTLHLYRSGGTAADVAEIPPSRISYAQICDARGKGPDIGDKAAVLREAVEARYQVGEGELDVAAMVRALPEGVPLSVEVRSRSVNAKHPDAGERSRVMAEVTRKFLSENGL
jgi:sugar phosphate isomerase/epimerase